MILKGILRCFELALGLKVNLHKSRIGGNGVKSMMIYRFFNNFELQYCDSTFHIFRSTRHKRKDLWESMITKIQKNIILVEKKIHFSY